MSLGFVVCSVGGSVQACRHTAPTYTDSYKDLLSMLFLPAAGQPSPAKTLLHKGPAQGTFSQGLMANRLIARYVCTQPIQHNRVPPEEHLFYALCPVGVSAGLKTDDHSPKAKTSQTFIHPSAAYQVRNSANMRICHWDS